MSRDALRERGRKVAAELKQPTSGHVIPGFDDFKAEVVYGAIWDRPGLAKPDRALATLAALSVLQRHDALASGIETALDLGVPARSILEVFVQVGLYAGFVTTDASARIAERIFAARAIAVPPDPPLPRADNAELDRRGRELMATLHGERASQGYAAPGNAITGELYPAAIRYGYGELWFRHGLDNRQRMLCAIAAFTAMGLEGQLRKFSRSALNIGLTRQEVIEAVIQTGPYGGFPRALNALGVLSEVL